MDNYTKAKVFKFKKDHILYKYGNKIKGESIFYLKSGKVQTKYNLGRGKKFILISDQGSLFGIFETLSGLDKRITEVKFLEDSIVFLWTKDDFLMDTSINQDLGMKSISFLSSVLRNINQKIQETS